MTTRATSAPRTEVPAEPANLEPVYIWDLVVRSTHWLIVFSLISLAITGVYMSRPFIISGGPANQRFIMGGVKIVHFYSAIVFSLAVFSRILWMFIGSRWARWSQLVPWSRKRRRDMLGTFKFYLMLRDKPPFTVGHNPLAGATYVAVFLLYLVMILTGFALYSVSAHGSYMGMWDFLLPIFGGAQGARWLHHIVMWLLIGFAVHHIFSALLVSQVEKNGTLDSIFSGYKFLDAEDVDQEIEASSTTKKEAT